MNLLLLLLTSLAWGSSFMFNELALEGYSPVGIAAGRLVFGALTLWIGLTAVGRLASSWRAGFQRGSRGGLLLVGALTATPFTLISVAQQQIDSSVAGIANASTPLFAGLLGMLVAHSERPTPRRWAGLLLGFAGVCVLMLSKGIADGAGSVVSIGWSILAASMYATGAIYIRTRLRGVPPTMVATWSITWGALLLLPAALWSLTQVTPTPLSTASVLVLGIWATGIGVLLYYHLLARVGAARAATVNYLLPMWAVLWGWSILGESIRGGALAALVMILAGVAVAAGGDRPRAASRSTDT